MTLRNVYWQDETADLGFDLGFDWRVRNKQNSISYSNVSRVRMYGKLQLNAWHKAINNIRILTGGSLIKEKRGWAFPPA